MQYDVHPMRRASNVTGPRGYAARRIKLNQVALLPIVVARPVSNVPPP